jgi:hypothetical protein
MGLELRAKNPIGGGDLWGWKFEPDTMSLDCGAASKERMLAALKDCYQCRAAEYPETREGYERAVDRSRMLESWIEARWRDDAKGMIAEATRGARNLAKALYSR